MGIGAWSDWRIAAVADDLAYVKNKGARDLLIGLGLVERAIAFDTRLVNVLEHLGAKLRLLVVSCRTPHAHFAATGASGLTGRFTGRHPFKRFSVGCFAVCQASPGYFAQAQSHFGLQRMPVKRKQLLN